MTDPAPLLQEADRAAATGDLARARLLLRDVVAASPDLFDAWLKLAAVLRALGNLPGALDAVLGALRVRPLDFTALLLRASLLDGLDHTDTDEAYDQALAQRPTGAAPPHMATAIAQAERRVAAYRAARDVHLKDILAGVEQAASPAEARRISRFRTNVARTTRVYRSEPTHFHYPGLAEQEFHDRDRFPWLVALEQATDLIASELAAVMAAERAELTPYIQYPAHEPMRQWLALNNSLDWTAIHLLQNGERVHANARHCPGTMALLSDMPQPRIRGCSPNAMFSLLAPGVTIPPHTGVANTRLVCHLPLIIPVGCWFRVGAETRLWQRGEAFVFDDTIEHEACNPSQELRAVLIVDIWHPDLTSIEQEAVRLLMESDSRATTVL